MSVTGLAVVLAFVERALAEMEAEAGWQPDDHLAGMLIRRRHSLRLLRRALAGADVEMLRAARAVPLRSSASGDLGGMLMAEDRLAAMLDGWIEGLGPTHPQRDLALHLRSECDDAARVLRMVMASRSERPPE